MLSRYHLANKKLFQITIQNYKIEKVTTIINPWTKQKNQSRNYQTISCRNQYSSLAKHLLPSVTLLASNNQRFISNNISDEIPNKISPDLLDKIPDAPIIPQQTTPTIFDNASEQLSDVVAGSASTLAEPTFASIGLGGWSPVGIVQNCMEWLHIGCDLPWWGSIAIGTIVVRTLIFPLVIMAQRNAAKMNNNLPQMQVLQMKMTEARQSGNALESARYAQEMVQFMREKDMNPFKNMLVPLAQAPLFISFFIGLRQMTNAPVESLQTGGLFWFQDLILADQYFLLPLITSATLYATIEVGTDSAKLSAQNMQTMRYVLRAMPIIIFPFTMNFPAAILCYWACSNFISLIQVGCLRIPSVREYFNIEKAVVHQADTLPIKKKPFVQGIKESWTNMKISRELAERERIDEIQFQRAGKGALIKTYKYDPTKARETNSQSTTISSTASTIHAKKR